jgi:ketosteroid isomerase-like protein
MSSPMSRLTKPLLFASSAECEQAFYEALEGGDIDALTDLLHDDEDVCCVHPGGPRLIGFAAVRASWAAILANGALRIRAHARKTVETPAVALHNVIEELVVEQGRQPKIVRVIATNGYVKTPAGWKMVLHHASPAPEGPVEEFEAPTGPLH